ncbi:2-oxoacid:acceptor oxidoreductase, gamma subunit, pyruvate/2-ketoisovalerate family [Desulfosporosinus orientis DSM 765]|uniref:2-oxoacid:acceptor oxidoreductase, gamma subunit, pyruvate/2-ketoisovalerate family n=1 Tax=Desulfosporosinus orientis (strain ATCC 19365 / DSM 765 / NCIMB 8382 / VKM B-1628 / Singapore I) TaxID=768706 RepID=G7W886_DESOD|nr:2-oxoacid:acceptor oxidoreductase family protein [Desulfosporosinus orientis]AET66732.1 2-oxoacid:acceptor oxidoreductase, gamma subunit, pyruvate/2-ketoisovalerate family [Desulfosporosinus orientis DSM 765]
MLQKIILAGFGGQGVMSMGQLLAYAGLVEKKHVSWIPSYGPEMRGGTANCSVTISDEEVSSPIITEPDTLIVLNRPSLEKFEKDVKRGGRLLINSSLIQIESQRQDLQVLKIDASEMAREIGNNRVSNMIILGAFIELTRSVTLESVIGALKQVLPEYRYNLIPLNRQALEKGIQLAKGI